ncbi:hypothetical protein ACI78V_15985 [Geodermatophilus sp. SYSU D00742]
MISAAGLLVLIGLGMFVGGLVTDTTAFYWVCVASCGVAAVLLVLTRVGPARHVADPAGRAVSPAAVRGPASGGHRAADGPASGGQRAAGGPASGGQRAVDGPGSGGHRAAGWPLEDDPGRAVRPPAAGEEPVAREWAGRSAAGEAPTNSSAAGNGADDRGTPDDAPTGAHVAAPAGVRSPSDDGEPVEEDVEVTDLLLVVDLADDVLVVDEHPRYHVAGCVHLRGETAIPLPVVEARADGFTPCGTCRPVRHLADIERTRRRTARGN